MDNQDMGAQPPAPPTNNIPEHIVNEIPMNNNSMEDVTGAPVDAVPPQPGHLTPLNNDHSLVGVPQVNNDVKPLVDSGSLHPVPPPPPVPPMPSPIDQPLTPLPPLPPPPPPLDIPMPPSSPMTSSPMPEERTGSSVSELQKNELINIKKNALRELNPLVGHLKQEPAEHFQTLLDMIRASDDASLVQSAYDAANAIDDEEKRTKALLEIVKEVNYLTQSKDQKSEVSPKL